MNLEGLYAVILEYIFGLSCVVSVLKLHMGFAHWMAADCFVCMWALEQMLGDEIGKGAYGRVYKGLDLENGDFVAIKQVSLENIAQEDLNIIMV